MKSKRITKVITPLPGEDMHVCTKCHGNPSNNCRDVSLKTTNVNQQIFGIFPGLKYYSITKIVAEFCQLNTELIE